MKEVDQVELLAVFMQYYDDIIAALDRSINKFMKYREVYRKLFAVQDMIRALLSK